MCPAVDTRVKRSIAHAAEALFATQLPDGSFPSRRPTAVPGTAGALAALHFADRERSADLITRGTRWLATAQNPDGGWGGIVGAPTQMVPTVVAAATLHLLDPRAQAKPVRRARDPVTSLGGVESLTDPGVSHTAATSLCWPACGTCTVPGASRWNGSLCPSGCGVRACPS